MPISCGYNFTRELRLTSHYRLELCGSAVPLLQNYDFRLTRDIDFSKPVDNITYTLIQKVLKDSEFPSDFLDTQAVGVVCLLEDYEDRLVEIKDNFKHVQVYVLSIEDWMISKLEAPKFDDLLKDCGKRFVTKERVDWMQENMHLYCGLKPEYAQQSLDILKRELDTDDTFTTSDIF